MKAFVILHNNNNEDIACKAFVLSPQSQRHAGKTARVNYLFIWLKCRAAFALWDTLFKLSLFIYFF